MSTPDRILQAASALFAEKGFRRTTVQEICMAAEANIAAVNYHFKGKEALYEAVWQQSVERAREAYPAGFGEGTSADSAEALKEYILGRILTLCDPIAFCFPRIMARELVQPTAAFAKIFATVLEPEHRRLESILSRLLGPEGNEADLALASQAVTGQLMLLLHHERPRRRLFGDAPPETDALVEIAERITRFVLGGIQATRRVVEARHAT